jgi:hypothetical protein
MRNMTTQGRGMQRSARQQLKLGKLVGRQSKGCEKGKMSATSEQQLETTVTHFVLRTLSTHTQNAPCTHTHLVHTHLVHTRTPCTHTPCTHTHTLYTHTLYTHTHPLYTHTPLVHTHPLYTRCVNDTKRQQHGKGCSLNPVPLQDYPKHLCTYTHAYTHTLTPTCTHPHAHTHTTRTHAHTHPKAHLQARHCVGNPAKALGKEDVP